MSDDNDNRALYEAATAGDLTAELEVRGLPKSGAKPELVDRLVAHDADQAPAPPAPDADPEPEVPICGLCWPTGWPDDHTQAHCVHGEYAR